MRDDVIHSGPARIVLAAAAQLRDPELTERYREEWLANLRHRTHQQQWRDAVSLLLRGAPAIRWAYRPQRRIIVASQATMALVVAIGTILRYTMMPSKILVMEFAASGHLVASWGEPPILAISLTAAGAIGLALLARQSWRTALGWLAIGILVTQAFANTLPYNMYFISPPEEHATFFPAVAPEPIFAGTWWVVIASYWVLYAALTLPISREIPSVMRVLAASEVVVILYRTGPAWAYQYAHQLGLTDLVPWLAGLGHVPTSEEGTALMMTPGIGLLFIMLIVVALWRFVVIVTSLVLLTRRGTRTCLQ